MELLFYWNAFFWVALSFSALQEKKVTIGDVLIAIPFWWVYLIAVICESVKKIDTDKVIWSGAPKEGGE